MKQGRIWSTASHLHACICSGEQSVVDLVEACLAQIDALDGQLHAFLYVDRDGALAAARDADEAVRRGRPLGPLHGIPVAIKDDVWVAGMPATVGSMVFAHFVPSADGTVASRLRAAGAIIIGKTNLPEFTSWPRSKSYLGGETVNPWDLTRISGASSGGSAAAVAAGMVPLAIGTDGGGSVRIPASLCGIVGLLPTIGRVPDHGGFLCSPLSSCGPMARSVGDVALLQQVIAGPDDAVANSHIGTPPELLSGLDAGVEGLRVAWSADHGRVNVQPGVLIATDAALQALALAGAQINKIDRVIPHPWGDGQLMAGLYAAAADWSEPDPVSFADIPETAFAEPAIAQSSADASGYFAVAEVQGLLQRSRHLLTPPSQLVGQTMKPDAVVPSAEQLRAAMDAIWADHDVLCSPTMAWVAPVAPRGWASPYPNDYSGTDLTFIANAMGCPSVSVPCGLCDGLPVGFQIIGRPGDEATVLRVAQSVEVALGRMSAPQFAAGGLDCQPFRVENEARVHIVPIDLCARPEAGPFADR